MTSGAPRRVEHLAAPTCSLIVDVSSGIPAIVHWGRPLADHDLADADSAANNASLPFGSLDVAPVLTVVPLHGDGFSGRPGLRAIDAAD
ncbi:MAG: alpha-galactosidase, partial [Actinomycetota bacterium]